MIKVVLPIYFKQSKKKTVLLGLNWYRNVHYQVNNKAKLFISELIEDTVEGEPILDKPIHVHYKVYLKRKGSDGGNIRSVMEKYALDGLKKAKYITEDNAQVIISDSSEYFIDKDFPRCEIILTEAQVVSN